MDQCLVCQVVCTEQILCFIDFWKHHLAFNSNSPWFALFYRLHATQQIQALQAAQFQQTAWANPFFQQSHHTPISLQTTASTAIPVQDHAPLTASPAPAQGSIILVLLQSCTKLQIFALWLLSHSTFNLFFMRFFLNPLFCLFFPEDIHGQ